MGKPRDEWYDQPRWQKLRKTALRRDGFQDQEAKRFGKVKPAEVVHHIFPKDEFPQYAFCLWNLISVSRMTHNTFHDRDTDELTEKGMELLRRTARRNKKEIPPKYMDKKAKGKKPKSDGYYYD